MKNIYYTSLIEDKSQFNLNFFDPISLTGVEERLFLAGLGSKFEILTAWLISDVG